MSNHYFTVCIWKDCTLSSTTTNLVACRAIISNGNSSKVDGHCFQQQGAVKASVLQRSLDKQAVGETPVTEVPSFLKKTEWG